LHRIQESPELVLRVLLGLVVRVLLGLLGLLGLVVLEQPQVLLSEVVQ
jgi:hypothetical protein